MTNLEKLRTMDSSKMADLINDFCCDSGFRKRIIKMVCSEKHCGYAEFGTCLGPGSDVWVCPDALAHWLDSEAEEWGEEKVIHRIKKGKSNLCRHHIYKRKFTVTVYIQKKIHSLLEEIKNKEPDGTAIEHTKAAELPF